MEFTQVLTVGGIGLTVALLETVLESMEKPVYSTVVRILAIGAFTMYSLKMFGVVLGEMEAFITSWN